MTFRISLLFVTLFSMTGCRKSSDPNASASNLIPMKVGNEWVYLLTTYDQNGAIISSFNFPDHIHYTAVRDGNTYFYGREMYRNIDTNTVEVYRSSGKKEIYLKRVAVDATTIYTDTLSHIDTSVHKLIGYTAKVTINGYECIRNEEIYTRSGFVESKTVYFIRPGLGLVRIDSYYGNTYLHEREDLVSFSLQ